MKMCLFATGSAGITRGKFYETKEAKNSDYVNVLNDNHQWKNYLAARFEDVKK